MHFRRFIGTFLTVSFWASFLLAQPVPNLNSGPAVLVLYDGLDQPRNVGRLDAFYLGNLLGHFTTRRTIHSIETYQAGEWKQYDAVFVMIYQKRYDVPSVFIDDIARSPRTFCWLGNQVGQLDRRGFLKKHGLRFIRFFDRVKFTHVFYKGQTLVKGDPETNWLAVRNPDLVKVLATTTSRENKRIPYAMQSKNFWVFADSPFSYSGENDRYLVLCDLLHDILGISHVENHPALLRIEDINAMSVPKDLDATLRVIRRHKIPFSFGFVPMYVNPEGRQEFRMADKPEVVRQIGRYIKAGGVPILHGFTHQYRGVSTDDYEFWDDLSDRPVRGDSETFATRRITDAIKEALALGVYPAVWETPHYAASPLDYRVFRRFFNTVFERRLAGPSLDSDQFFPYPVVDMNGQYVIPESLAYIPIDDQRIEPILQAADAEQVVRDGYASFFFHPFLKPQLLDEIIAGVKKRGFTFIDLRSFPNEMNCEGHLVKTGSGPVEIAGHGRFLNEYVLGPRGQELSRRSEEVPPQALLKRQVHVLEGQTYVARRQDVPAPGVFKKLWHLAKGDLSVLQRKLESVLAPHTVRSPVKTIILWNAKAKGEGAIDQESFWSTFTNLGFDVDKIDYTRFIEEDLGPFTMLVIPWATAKSLPQNVVERIVTALNGGITLITDGESPISQELGIRLEGPIPVQILQDHLLMNQETRWADRPLTWWIAEPSPKEASVYYSDRESQHPLVISKRQREGRYLYFAPLFDSLTGKGYARFPNLPQILLNELHVSPMGTRIGADVYFDPGYRQNISIEVLAKMWRRSGIRAVHVAAWHFYNKYTYDYARLVKVAHQNGILVYAWFEWPHISKQFWEQHPHWREKTALLADAQVDWRSPMNLQDPACLKMVLSDLRNFMSKFDWDGADIGELTFESLSGPERPNLFTPLNNQARREFEALQHFDPVELFQKDSAHYWERDPAGLQAFYDYRRAVNTRLLKTFLDFFQKLGKEQNRQWEIIVTMLDAATHPELSDYLAIDLPRTIELVNHTGATLQVEDPASDWSSAPDRYTRIGERYKKIPLRKPFMIDINVLDVHDPDLKGYPSQKAFPTLKPTGVELIQLWHAASDQASRVCFYAESTINEPDWEIMPFAMAGHASARWENDHWVVQTPNTIRLDVGRDSRKFRLDGKPWHCAEKGSVWIPAGEHTLSFSRKQHSWFDASQLETHLISISGELVTSERLARGLAVTYDSPSRCALMFNKMPYKTTLDGQPAKLSSIRGDDGYTVLAPPGRHRLEVICETPVLYLVEFTSLVSASLIVIFGLASSGLLAILIFFIILNRRTKGVRSRVLNRFQKGTK
ncbi:MAG: polysaccharide deacetylase family protein [Elusimicrobiota bacterium]|jgi:uncharacterized protein YdaL